MSWSTKIFGEDLSKNYIFEMQQERFKIFKSQDLEAGNFDVTFEVEGKKLFGHKFILEPISETLKSMLSDRWTTKDEPVKIESYSYDNFYEFLCFVYSGSCNLNAENVFPMVDMAEFYAVSFLKDYCEKYILRTMKITIENIEEMSEFADKYSLNMFMDSIVKFLRQNNRKIIKDEKFSLFKKTFIEFLSTIPRDHDYYRDGNYYSDSYIKESEFFQSVYKWAQQQVNMKQEAAKEEEEEGFNLVEAIKAELSTILPKIKFGKMKIEFLMKFVGMFLLLTLMSFIINVFS
uniref:BTB domain-containing protein n=1 Tax=Panagrolaimus davidi TaxID=227884 RepID=A0A914P726_9BILA